MQMNNEVVHNILLKRAKEAAYKKFEIEQINLQYENFLIDFYLKREAFNKMKDFKISEEELKKVYEDNKERYVIEIQVKVDTIFLKDKEAAEKVLKEVNDKNFQEYKEKYDEKVSNQPEDLDKFVPLSSIQPQIAEAVLKQNKKGIFKKLVEVRDGFHILFLKEKEEEKIATYEEAKKILLDELYNSVYQQYYNEVANSIVNEDADLDVKIPLKEEEENKEEKK